MHPQHIIYSDAAKNIQKRRHYKVNPPFSQFELIPGFGVFLLKVLDKVNKRIYT